jgi:hypothetical protein
VDDDLAQVVVGLGLSSPAQHGRVERQLPREWIGVDHVIPNPGSLRELVLEQPMHQDHLTPYEFGSACDHVTGVVAPVSHDLQTEVTDRATCIAPARSQLHDRAPPPHERDVRTIEGVD